MAAQDRTIRASQDLDWLPPSFKALRWTVAGSIWAGLTGVLGMLVVFAKHGFFLYGKGIALLFAGGYYAGDKAAKAVLRRRLSALAHGDVELKKLRDERDGELVHVRGRVRARALLTSVLEQTPCVYRRVVFSVGGERWVHEAGEDFFLEGDDGEKILVEVDGARLVAADPKRARVEGPLATEVFDLTYEKSLRGANATRDRQVLRVTRSEPIAAGEVVIRPGDELEVVGYKTRSVDPTLAERLERETPLRVTLRAGRELPLLLAPSGRRAKPAAPPAAATTTPPT